MGLKTSRLTLEGLTPVLDILGDKQTFRFDNPIVGFSLHNLFSPTGQIIAATSLEFRNAFENGFRFLHITEENNRHGQVEFVFFTNAEPWQTPIMTLFKDSIVFNQPLSVEAVPQNPHDVVNKEFIDGLRLDNFSPPEHNINMNNFSIVNLKMPDQLNHQAGEFDAVNRLFVQGMAEDLDEVLRAYVDAKTAAISTVIKLAGSITGEGKTGETITTRLSETQTLSSPLLKFLYPALLENPSITHVMPNVMDFITKWEAGSDLPVSNQRSASLRVNPGFATGISGLFELVFTHVTGGSVSPLKVFFTEAGNKNSAKITLDATLDMQNRAIVNCPEPTVETHPATKKYVDTSITAVSSKDRYLTLTPLAGEVLWDFSKGNVAKITLDSPSTVLNLSNMTTRGTLTIIQDATGSRKLTIFQDNVYRSDGLTSLDMPLSTAANAIDVFEFQKDTDGKIFYWAAGKSFKAIVSAPQKFSISGGVLQVTIPVSRKKICVLKLLGGAGGSGVTGNPNVAGRLGAHLSGAGGYTIYVFDTTNYIGQTLWLKAGSSGTTAPYYATQGSGGGNTGGGYSNGDSRNLSEYQGAGGCGGGGGASLVSLDTLVLAVAGGGGGGAYPTWLGQATYGGAGGGELGQNASGASYSSGGTQSAGGYSQSGYGPTFQSAVYLRGASHDGRSMTYVNGGAGGGWYGGGIAGGTPTYDGNPHPQAASGGSGYINKTFPGFLVNGNSRGFAFVSETLQGSYNAISSKALGDSDFIGFGNGGSAWYAPAYQYPAGFTWYNGQGKIVAEFY